MPLFVLPVLLLASCQQEPADLDTAPTASAAEDTGVDDAPDLDAEEVGAEVIATLSEGVLSCRDVALAYDEVRAEGDDTGICPGGRPSNAESAVEDIDFLSGCTSESGYYFRGVANYTWKEKGDLDAGSRELMAGLWADLTVIDPDAQRMDAAGECTYDVAETLAPDRATTLAVDSVLLGAWLVPWQDDGMSEKLSSIMDSHLVGPVSSPGMSLDGAYGVGQHYLAFYELTYNEVCPGGVAGALALRGQHGYWYDLDFGSDCDDCAQVSYHAGAHDLGELCLPGIHEVLQASMARLYPLLDQEAP